MRIGVVSIRPSISDAAGMPFDDLYQAVGLNTGNFMFTQAMYRNLAGQVEQVGFSFEPEVVNATYTHLVIPAANWLNARSEWDWLCDRIEKVDIPVVTIGLGLQAETLDMDRVTVTPSCLRLAQLLSRKGVALSTRGTFTRDWLASVGIQNAVATGCPSLYMTLLAPFEHGSGGGEDYVIQSTRYRLGSSFLNQSSLNRMLFTAAAKHDAWMVYQSEPEEIEYLVYGKTASFFRDQRAGLLASLYGVGDTDRLVSFLDRRGRVFFDLESWARFLVQRRGQIGTRLHGAILALNHGVPAYLFAHDSRTSELIDFAAIPTSDLGTLEEIASPSQIFKSAPISEKLELYGDRRRKNLEIYTQFLSANGLQYVQS